MKRRINIAASLLHRPELLIMDEPTVGIDPQSRNNILETVRRLNTELSTTVVYTSHYLEEVEFLCQRLAIVDHGRVIAQSTLDEVRPLVGRETTVRLKVFDANDRLVTSIAAVPGVRQAWRENGSVVAMVEEAATALTPLMNAVAAAGSRLLGIQVEEPTLETVFLHLTGYLFSFFIPGLVRFGLLVGLTGLLFRVNWGPLPQLLAMAAVFILCASGLGFFLAGIVRTAEQQRAAGMIFVVATSMLGGAYWPLELASPIMQRIGYLTPQAWAMEGFREVCCAAVPGARWGCPSPCWRGSP